MFTLLHVTHKISLNEFNVLQVVQEINR